MDSLAFFKALAKSTHKARSYFPSDNDGKCPYCTYPFYETKSEIQKGIDEVECLNCHKRFFITIQGLLKKHNENPKK